MNSAHSLFFGEVYLPDPLMEDSLCVTYLQHSCLSAACVTQINQGFYNLSRSLPPHILQLREWGNSVAIERP